MNNKRLISMVVVVVMLASLLTACGSKKSTKDVLGDAILNQQNFKSGETKAEINISVKPSAAMEQDFDLMLSMLSNIKLSFEGKTNNEQKKALLEGNLELGGMSFGFTLATYDNKIALNAPMLGQLFGEQKLVDGFIIVDPKEIDPNLDLGSSNDLQINKDVVGQLIEAMINGFSDTAISDKGKVTINAGKDISARKIEVTVDKEQLKSVINSVMILLKDEKVRQELVNMLEGVNGVMDKQQLEDSLASMEFNVDEIFEQMENAIDFSKTNAKLNFFIDDKDRLVKTSSQVELRIKEDTEYIDINVDADITLWNINNVKDIEMPVIDDQNSVGIQELLNLDFFNLII